MRTPTRPPIPVVLDAVRKEGGYRSEKQLADALGEKQQTVNAWKRAKGWPGRFQLALQRFALANGYDISALVEGGRLVKSTAMKSATTVSDYSRAMSRADSASMDAQILAELRAIRALLTELVKKRTPT